MKTGSLEWQISAALLALLVVCSFALPTCSASEIPRVGGDRPKIVLPFAPGSEVALAVYVSSDASVTHYFWFWVIDADGFDRVILIYRLLSKGVWHNITATETDGNATKSHYEVRFIGPKDAVDWKVFASDTMGHWTENGTIRFWLDTMGIDPTIVLVAGLIPIPVVLSGIVLHRRRPQA